MTSARDIKPKILYLFPSRQSKLMKTPNLTNNQHPGILGSYTKGALIRQFIRQNSRGHLDIYVKTCIKILHINKCKIKSIRIGIDYKKGKCCNFWSLVIYNRIFSPRKKNLLKVLQSQLIREEWKIANILMERKHECTNIKG